jgi:hypothetical protein
VKGSPTSDLVYGLRANFLTTRQKRRFCDANSPGGRLARPSSRVRPSGMPVPEEEHPIQPNKSGNPPVICSYCKKRNHKTEDCRKRKLDANSKTATSFGSTDKHSFLYDSKKIRLSTVKIGTEQFFVPGTPSIPDLCEARTPSHRFILQEQIKCYIILNNLFR